MNHSPDEKLAAVLEYLTKKTSVDEICKAHGIRSRKTVYNWHQRLLASAHLIFAERRGAPRRDSRKLAPIKREPNEANYSPSGDFGDCPWPDDEPDKEIGRLLGVDEAELERMVARRPKKPADAGRGRQSLKRTVAKSLRRKQEERGDSVE
jgi:transposase